MAKTVEILGANTMDVAVDVRKRYPSDSQEAAVQIVSALRYDALMKTGIRIL